MKPVVLGNPLRPLVANAIEAVLQLVRDSGGDTVDARGSAHVRRLILLTNDQVAVSPDDSGRKSQLLWALNMALEVTRHLNRGNRPAAVAMADLLSRQQLGTPLSPVPARGPRLAASAPAVRRPAERTGPDRR